MLKPRFEYKAQAKQLMAGKYLNVIIILVIYSVAVSAITGLFYRPTAQGLSSIAGLIDMALTAGFSYGVIRLWRQIVDGKNPDLQDILLCGYKENYVRSLIVYLLQSLFVFLFSLLLIIPGIIKSYGYSLTFYLLHKDPNIKQMDVLKKSEEMMKGYKSELFMLDLSYIGWYFLSIFTFGILLLWVVPKHQTARMLYLDEIYAKSAPVVAKPVE